MSDRKRWITPFAGVVVGVGVFVGVNVATGRAIVPTVASVKGVAAPTTVDLALQPGAPAAPTGPYQVACGVCHQPEGQGIPFAFPPLAGSHWITGDPETPIRIVLLGLGGPIEVNGSSFNLVMPPPGTAVPGSTVAPVPLDDAAIAEAITYARTNFGNNASAVDAEMVKKVRDSLGGRTTPWTAAELTALRTGAASSGAAANAGAAVTAATAPAEGAAAAAVAGTKKAQAKAGAAGSGPR
jgi:mono/diheme cytochrome c family protein